MTVVISQPMLFPWVGMFEQIRLADVFVHYDDAQFSKGSFTNRVQIKAAGGPRWMTIPLRGLHLGDDIRAVEADDSQDWRARHLSMLSQAYSEAPCAAEMFDLVRSVYGLRTSNVAELTIASMETVASYLRIGSGTNFIKSSDIETAGSSSERVLAIVKELGGDRYVTGHGARNYLDHALFSRNGVAVEYMDYRRTPYPQLHGDFDPHVSILDLIANLGVEGAEVVASGTKPWQEHLHAA